MLLYSLRENVDTHSQMLCNYLKGVCNEAIAMCCEQRVKVYGPNKKNDKLPMFAHGVITNVHPTKGIDVQLDFDDICVIRVSTARFFCIMHEGRDEAEYLAAINLYVANGGVFPIDPKVEEAEAKKKKRKSATTDHHHKSCKK